MTDTTRTDPTDAASIRTMLRTIAGRRARNHQAHIGPSEIGGHCDRRLGYRMLGVDKVNTDSDPLASWIGTAVHSAIEAALADDDDWMCEVPVTLPGYDIRGTLDAYHIPTRTICDWKIVGDTTLTKTRAAGLSAQYRTQIHAYGLGMDMAGNPVDTVAVVMIPRSGRLSNLLVVAEPLNHDVVEGALRRIEALRSATDLAGAAILPSLSTGDQFCTGCPWYLPAATDPTEACAGHR